MLKLSIIIPVFNAEKYLTRCLKSILAYPKLIHEVIIVSDHSTDESSKIARAFQEKFPDKVKVFCSTHTGAGASRNLGVVKSTGDYIWFIDADDYIAKDAISKLIHLANKTKAELIMFGAERRFNDGAKLYVQAASPKQPDFRHLFVRLGPGPWQFLIDRKWWIKNNFVFKEGVIHEDVELLPSLILYAKKYDCILDPLYFYCENTDSVLHTAAKTKKCCDIFSALEGLYYRFKRASAEKEYADDLEWFFIWNLLNDSAKDFQKSPYGKYGWRKTRNMLREYFPNWRKNKYLKRSSLRFRVKIFINYHCRPKM